jgi:hypothetical protein
MNVVKAVRGLALGVAGVAGILAGVAMAGPGAKRPPKRVAKASLPPGVSMVAQGVWGGAMSPDGASLAHYTGMKSRQLAITGVDGAAVTIATDEKSCSSSACLDDRCSRVEWSPDGGRVAMRLDSGLFEVDVASEAKRRVDADDARATCNFRFAGDGVLEWVATRGKGESVMRDGQAESVVDLPKSATATQLGDRFIVSERYEYRRYPAAWTDLWIVDRQRQKVKRVYHRADISDDSTPMYEPRLSPDESRVCWLNEGVRCVSTKTWKQTQIATTAGRGVGRWGHEKTLPFSPSGRLLAYRVGGEAGDTLMVHDFSTGNATDVLAPMRHQDYAFQGEELIVMYEQEDWRDSSIPPIVRLDLDDGSETSIVSSAETQYNSPILSPVRTDVLFIGRERPSSGARDLVKVDVAAAIKGAK